MKNIAFIFPGQGAQYPGMGKELAENFPEAMEVFEKANLILNMDIKQLCFEGPQEQLNITENTQPAILTTSLAIAAILEKKNIRPQMTAGLSLGEYASLAIAGSLSIEDAIAIVRKRGKYMQEAVPVGVGKMAAIIGLKKEDINEICRLASSYGIVEAANFNCPGQIVIAGEAEAVEQACKIAKKMGAKRATLLAVSAPFHTSLLKPAGEKLKKEFKNYTFHNAQIPVVANVNASVEMDADEIKNNLIKQVSSSVLWEDCMNTMIEEGMDTFIEIGPGRTLTSFGKKINKEINYLRVEDLKTLNKTLEELEV
ncbi:ACP S-malonyltransferase [Garciella nitratireducens]|uniref:Malonyl CoA-acyl carrier protein transacylase n=1 Tax=Garciella nitratireducens DSM 15102 TaxID=1121911 RepID=A0A1T4JYC0_9FIRM|nr:ACP S-malonyltransferase [Garciella nitratireducens]RBP41130.1 [acyl-carrier-protein] S-malonyltransferase [Garciella nitratireducens]SJZ35128.1 [Acyl-carrier-protein] S-malonyltransferase [Garciella nitratireducens DSM 15102]